MKRLRLLTICGLLSLLSFTVVQIDKKAFYNTLSSGSEEMIDNELKVLDQANASSQVTAYQGALLMKKAGFVKGVKGKVKTFKMGAKKLEGEIEKRPASVEYRFLRLTIQEHAPKILNYDKKMEEDKAIVMAGYEKCDTSLKSVIANYSLSSKVLKESDLKGK